MIKLQAAKCPQCGADIQVNHELKQTICQYCGSLVLVEDAVAKYKIELSGKVKVDGIKARDDQLIQAKKHYQIGEYLDARKNLHEILNQDNFDIEALYELIKNDVEILKEQNYNPLYLETNPKYNKEYKDIFYELETSYNRIKKTDKEESYKMALKDYLEDIERLIQLLPSSDKVKELIKKINIDVKNDEKVALAANIKDKFYIAFRMGFQINNNMNLIQGYIISNIEEIHSEGSVTLKVFRMNKLFNGQFQKEEKSVFIEPDSFISSYDELEERYNKYKELYKGQMEKIQQAKSKNTIISIIVIIVTAIILWSMVLAGNNTNRDDKKEEVKQEVGFIIKDMHKK